MKAEADIRTKHSINQSRLNPVLCLKPRGRRHAPRGGDFATVVA
jgi:hypothetical protein